MHLDANGAVGIGTATHNLHLSDGAASAGCSFWSGQNNGSSGVFGGIRLVVLKQILHIEKVGIVAKALGDDGAAEWNLNFS